MKEQTSESENCLEHGTYETDSIVIKSRKTREIEE